MCPLVAGLPRDRGEFVLARVSQAARNAGVALVPGGCKANFLVLVSSNPVALLRDLESKKPGLFDIPEGMGHLRHFLETDRPVRTGGAPTEGMSSWDQALLKALYASRPTSVMQVSSMETQMLDSIERH
jgi:hypothetical protein